MYIGTSNFSRIKDITNEGGVVVTNQKDILKVPDYYIKTSFYNKLINHICANNFKNYTTMGKPRI